MSDIAPPALEHVGKCPTCGKERTQLVPGDEQPDFKCDAPCATAIKKIIEK